MTLVAYSRNLQSLYETPRDIPVEFSLDRNVLRQEFNSLIPENESVLSEEISKIILDAYGISVTQPILDADEKIAVKISNKIGYHVVFT